MERSGLRSGTTSVPILDLPSSYLVRCSTWWTILLLVEFEKNVCLLLMVKLVGRGQKNRRKSGFQSGFGAAVAQEVRAVVWQQEGCWLDPRAPSS